MNYIDIIIQDIENKKMITFQRKNWNYIPVDPQ